MPMAPRSPSTESLWLSQCSPCPGSRFTDLHGAFESFPPQQNHFTGHGPPPARVCLHPSVLSSWPDPRSAGAKGSEQEWGQLAFYSRVRAGQEQRWEMQQRRPGIPFPDTPSVQALSQHTASRCLGLNCKNPLTGAPGTSNACCVSSGAAPSTPAAPLQGLPMDRTSI